MTDDEIRGFAFTFAMQLPKAELDYPFGENIPVFKIMGKIFMLNLTLDGKNLINLKVQPEDGEMLRDIYESIHTGYHMNKRHWISIYEGEQITPELIQDLIKNSYDLVIKTLTKAQQQMLAVYAKIQ